MFALYYYLFALLRFNLALHPKAQFFVFSSHVCVCASANLFHLFLVDDQTRKGVSVLAQLTNTPGGTEKKKEKNYSNEKKKREKLKLLLSSGNSAVGDTLCWSRKAAITYLRLRGRTHPHTSN